MASWAGTFLILRGIDLPLISEQTETGIRQKNAVRAYMPADGSGNLLPPILDLKRTCKVLYTYDSRICSAVFFLLLFFYIQRRRVGASRMQMKGEEPDSPDKSKICSV